jgi:hypothetical protein
MRPPIATLLIGAGLFRLLRTSVPQRSAEPYMGIYDEDSGLKRRMGDGSIAARAADMADMVLMEGGMHPTFLPRQSAPRSGFLLQSSHIGGQSASTA